MKRVAVTRRPFASLRASALRAGGFTLIEVLVAVFVLGFALAAIVASTGRYAANAQILREKTLALWVAHNRLTEIGLQPAWPAIGSLFRQPSSSRHAMPGRPCWSGG